MQQIHLNELMDTIMLFKNEMWIRRPCLCVRHTGAINRARTVGAVNAARTVGVVNAAHTVGVVNAAHTHHRRGPIYRAHAPAPFMGEGSPVIHQPGAPSNKLRTRYNRVPTVLCVFDEPCSQEQGSHKVTPYNFRGSSNSLRLLPRYVLHRVKLRQEFRFLYNEMLLDRRYTH